MCRRPNGISRSCQSPSGVIRKGRTSSHLLPTRSTTFGRPDLFLSSLEDAVVSLPKWTHAGIENRAGNRAPTEQPQPGRPVSSERQNAATVTVSARIYLERDVAAALCRSHVRMSSWEGARTTVHSHAYIDLDVRRHAAEQDDTARMESDTTRPYLNGELEFG